MRQGTTIILASLLGGSPSYQLHVQLSLHCRDLSSSRRTQCFRLKKSRRDGGDITNVYGHDTRKSSSDTEKEILQLVQSHFVGQTVLTLMRLGVIDVLQKTEALSVDEIITAINTKKESTTICAINREALFRCLRLVCTTGVVSETAKRRDTSMEPAYFATDTGERLQTNSEQSMAPFLLHWLESPLWFAWEQLPDYVQGESDKNAPPFDRANFMSASEFYLQNAESCSHRNAVARYASSKEITSIIEAMKLSSHLNELALLGKVIVDVGGGYGDFVNVLKESMPATGECYCLDLPDVIKDATSTVANKKDDVNMPKLLAGNMFDPASIPTPCDIIFTKHVLCDFSDDDVILALQSFRKALGNSKEGRVVIMDAVLPNGDDLNGKWNAAVSFDVLLMLSGRRGERSRMEWSNLAKKAGFVLEEVLPTASVTVDLAVLLLDSP